MSGFSLDKLGPNPFETPSNNFIGGAIGNSEQIKDQGTRLKLRQQVTDSTDLDNLVKKELLLQFSRSNSSTDDLAKRFADAVNPEGKIRKDFEFKKLRQKEVADTPGLANQGLITGGLAQQNGGLITGGSR